RRRQLLLPHHLLPQSQLEQPILHRSHRQPRSPLPTRSPAAPDRIHHLQPPHRRTPRHHQHARHGHVYGRHRQLVHHPPLGPHKTPHRRKQRKQLPPRIPPPVPHPKLRLDAHRKRRSHQRTPPPPRLRPPTKLHRI